MIGEFERVWFDPSTSNVEEMFRVARRKFVEFCSDFLILIRSSRIVGLNLMLSNEGIREWRPSIKKSF